MRSVLTWLGWALLTGVAAAAGGLASRRAAGFYATLDRPAWAPPAWLFGPAWTVLYLMMATAAWLVTRADGPGRGAAVALYVVQLVANAAWTWIFFAWRRGGLAFGEVLLLLTLVALTLGAFWRVRPLAGALLVPYLAWVSFATALTWSVWRRNPAVL
jgi:tryptophan-rich sensory protein